MINGCGNCANYVWGDKKTPLPSECITCATTHVPNGQHPTPSHWKAKPQTNADRIRAMSDEELAELFSKMCENMHPDEEFCESCPAKGENCPNAYKEDWIKWLKQPAEGEQHERS